MNIHEYQAKQIFKEGGIPIPNGKAAFSVDEAVSNSKELGGDLWVVKAQIHAGGRGKAGGVKIAKSTDEVRAHASEILGKNLVTHQTGPDGKVVERLLIEEGIDIDKEFYLGVVLDRGLSRMTFMASSEGGTEIEEVASNTPEKIKKISIDPQIGFQAYHGIQLAKFLGLEGSDKIKKMVKFTSALFNIVMQKDASLVEINPLVLTKSGDILALDAKMNFDDNALFRQKWLLEYEDPSDISKEEREAKKYDLSYISLDGEIGCMVNGAGLAMGTMDMIKLAGGEPANFLDVGGGATKDKVTAAFKIILSDENVKAILVNIFGGIMKCDVIAEGVVQAAKEVDLKIPLVVRLEGTNVEEGKKIIKESGIDIIAAENFQEAAVLSVKASKGERG
jgi:succinyl-CoA synthetase beta subunit